MIGISIQEIERGTELAANVVASMQEVLDAIENVNGMIGKSAENNQTQNQNIEQIKLGIEEISKAVEDNSASAEETSATSEELAAQAATLEALSNILTSKMTATIQQDRNPTGRYDFLRERSEQEHPICRWILLSPNTFGGLINLLHTKPRHCKCELL